MIDLVDMVQVAVEQTHYLIGPSALVHGDVTSGASARFSAGDRAGASEPDHEQLSGRVRYDSGHADKRVGRGGAGGAGQPAGFPSQVLEQVRPGYTAKLDGHCIGLVAVIADMQCLSGNVELENLSGARVTIKLPLVRS